jgi:hypothetical protein
MMRLTMEPPRAAWRLSTPAHRTVGVTFQPAALRCLDTRHACHQASSPSLGNLWQRQALGGAVTACSGTRPVLVAQGLNLAPHVDTDPGEAVDLIGVSNIPEELLLREGCCSTTPPTSAGQTAYVAGVLLASADGAGWSMTTDPTPPKRFAPTAK